MTDLFYSSLLILSWDFTALGLEIPSVLVKVFEVFFIIAAGFIFSKLSKKLIAKLIRPSVSNENSILSEKRARTLQSVSFSFVKYSIYFLILYWLADIFISGQNNPLHVIAGTAGVAIGLGAQGLIKDIIAGFFIIFEDQFSIGDIIEIEGKTGTVEEIVLRSTKIRGLGGELYIIPNGIITTVTNWSKQHSKALVDIKVSHQEDIDKVMLILEDELKKAADIKETAELPAIMGITDWGDFNITLRVSVKCEPGKSWAVERELRLRIMRRFQLEGIKTPSPEIFSRP